ncbi:hypothetical protein [Ilumatobacter coccineus]|uniref:Uncharacterized protein n=1 Tax=Ilumatobacter coccineus (strain NBRC 103263 / KCTC 29153 / YM16-304) TaxID=1313172 RepID=A0A6C7E199_ILUCY|nr:hypothetical protein [Ilumatobacter coccineus]BAN00693.1 hypothetical protein YM304_03790 [Ilumatobacter coccineus YM16-304]
MKRRRLFEAVGVAALGGAMAAGAGSLVGLTVPLAAVGALNGAISGWRGVYEWSCSRGLVAFTLDSTWGLTMTTAGLFANAVGMAMPNSGYAAELSERQNRHVYRRGFMPRKGFAITLGNVIGGAGDIERERRTRLITDHEDVHCWQARWFGPFFPVLYVGWMIAGGGAGMVIWLVARRRDRFTKVVESSAYFINPFEWWAYSRDDYWPPKGKVEGMGWKRPCCRPLAEVKPRN